MAYLALPLIEPLRAFLADRLPAAAHPIRYVTLAALPRTTGRKVERSGSPRRRASPFEAPRWPTETGLATISIRPSPGWPPRPSDGTRIFA